MKLITTPLVVEENDGFKEDLFGLKEFGESLLNLIIQSDDELVISLDAQWGSGKTTFIKMWQGLLNENHIPNIYINAFANDYIDDPFITVAGAISNYITNNFKDENDKKVLKDNIKKVGGQILSLTAMLTIKAVTGGVIDNSIFKKIKKIFTCNKSSLVEGIINDKLNDYLERIKTIEAFKTLLSEIPLKIKIENKEPEPEPETETEIEIETETESEEQKVEINKNPPLVIIIDELDRCKPSYAVEMLEKIKHLFSTKNIVFLLAIHKEQLEKIIKHIYGQNVKANIYLQKFINIETILPDKVKDLSMGKETTSAKNLIYVEKLIKNHELTSFNDDNTITNCMEALITHCNLSLRQIEKAFTNLTFFYVSNRENEDIPGPFISFLAVIKVTNLQVFEKIRDADIDYKDISVECNFEKFTSDLNGESGKTSRKRIVEFIHSFFMLEKDFMALSTESTEKRIVKAYCSNQWGDIPRKRWISDYVKKLDMFQVN